MIQNFGISTEKREALAAKMASLGIREADLDEQFVRSGGPGGQNVNKVSTCVWLRHRPTGVEVKCMQERSQAMNRYRARQLLAQKIETMILGRRSAEKQRVEKIRRQKRRRSRRQKIKMLDDKRKHGAKKSLRSGRFDE